MAQEGPSGSESAAPSTGQTNVRRNRNNGNTGGCLTLGKGVIMPLSKRQKINTKSSTEAELVGADDYMPQVIWSRNFLQGQGFRIEQNILYQDNESAMLLERNGRASSSRRTKHIDVRYYFIKDRIKNGEVKVVYCPTDEMWADFFTKPLQGTKFIYFRNLLLNCGDPADPHRDVM